MSSDEIHLSSVSRNAQWSPVIINHHLDGNRAFVHTICSIEIFERYQSVTDPKQQTIMRYVTDVAYQFPGTANQHSFEFII